MMQDALTVAWKEFRELLNRRGSTKVTLASAGVILVIFGVVQPAEQWRFWFTSLASCLFLAFVPMVLIITTIADSFAGERERKTLETLLATRLSDGDILAGKLMATLAWAWGLTLVAALLGAITVDVARAQHGLAASFYDADVLGVALLAALLVGGFMAGLGTLVSLRASTVRAAQQIMGFVLAGTIAGTALLLSAGPESWRAKLASYFATRSLVEASLGVALVVLVVDVALLAACRAQFRRSKLILD